MFFLNKGIFLSEFYRAVNSCFTLEFIPPLEFYERDLQFDVMAVALEYYANYYDLNLNFIYMDLPLLLLFRPAIKSMHFGINQLVFFIWAKTFIKDAKKNKLIKNLYNNDFLSTSIISKQ